MNLWEIQSWVSGLLAAAPALSGLTILEDDGAYPKTPQREKTLNTEGLLIVVWDIDSDGLGDISQGGLAAHSIYVSVVVEENVSVNRATGGKGIQALQATQYILAALSGKKQAPQSREILLPMDPPFKNFGKINGVNRVIINFSLDTVIIPVP